MHDASTGQLAFRRWADISAFFCVLVSLFFLPISTSLNSLLIVAAVLALFGVQFKENIQKLLTFATTKWTAVLFGLMLLGVFYSAATMPEALTALKKYGFRLFAFVVLPPLFCKPKSRSYVFYTLIVGSLIYSSLDMFDQAGFISLEQWFNKPKHIILSQFPLSYYCAFAGIASLYLLSTRKDNSWLFAFCLLYLFGYLFFVNVQRGPMIVFIVMAFMFLFRNHSFKQKCMMIIPTMLTVIAIGLLSPVVQKRLGDTLGDIQKYQQGDTKTSIGVRAEFARYSQMLIKEKPLLGYGTGSFATVYATTGGPIVEEATAGETLGDPHNSFVHLWVQLGLVGVVAFIGWLASQWQFSRGLLANERILLQCFLVAFILSCFNESSFYRSRNAHLYITVAVVCMGNAYQTRRKTKRYYKKR